MIRAFFDNLGLAFGTFVAHPLRTMLTLLGIVIGVSTVMTMMALLEGLRVKVNKDFSQLGANVFRVDKWPQGFRFGGGGVDWNQISKRPDRSRWPTSARWPSSARRCCAPRRPRGSRRRRCAPR